MNTLLMKCNKIFRTTSPGEMTCELFGKKQRVHFKNNVGVLQTKRTRQAFEKGKIFSLIIGIFIPEETTRCSKSYASTQTTIIGRPHSGSPARERKRKGRTGRRCPTSFKTSECVDPTVCLKKSNATFQLMAGLGRKVCCLRHRHNAEIVPRRRSIQASWVDNTLATLDNLKS